MDDFVPQPTLRDLGMRGGRVLCGRYELGEQIGQGGMGQVWRAIDRTLNDREVACKMLPAELSSDAAALKQLKHEAEALLSLTHPSIVRLLNFEQDPGGVCFLVMEYVRGESLDKIIAREGPLSVSRAGKWLSQVAKAIDFAHGRKILHRDIKPGNILIDEHGNARLADFGLAQTIREFTTRVTGKTTSGTPAYMSPQQMFGQDHPSNDVYSFAATMYHVFAGRPPFFKGDLVAQVRFGTPAPIEGLSARIHAAMMKGLSKEVAERPESAGALVRLTQDRGQAPVPRPTAQQVNRRSEAPFSAPIPSEAISIFEYPKDADVWVDRAHPARFEKDALPDRSPRASPLAREFQDREQLREDMPALLARSGLAIDSSGLGKQIGLTLLFYFVASMVVFMLVGSIAHLGAGALLGVGAMGAGLAVLATLPLLAGRTSLIVERTFNSLAGAAAATVPIASVGALGVIGDGVLVTGWIVVGVAMVLVYFRSSARAALGVTAALWGLAGTATLGNLLLRGSSDWVLGLGTLGLAAIVASRVGWSARGEAQASSRTRVAPSERRWSVKTRAAKVAGLGKSGQNLADLASGGALILLKYFWWVVPILLVFAYRVLIQGRNI